MHNGINKLSGMVSLLTAQALLAVSALADGSAPAVPAGGAVAEAVSPARPGMLETLMPFLLMFGVMYLLILRPQQKKMKQQQEMLSKLVAGDDVVTTSGILGRVHSVEDKVITLEVADNVRMKFVRSQVAQKLSSDLQS